MPFPEPECPAADIAKRAGADTKPTSGPPGPGPDDDVDSAHVRVPNASAPLFRFCAAWRRAARSRRDPTRLGACFCCGRAGRARGGLGARGYGPPGVLATDGAGHVKAGNTDVCADVAGAPVTRPTSGAWSRPWRTWH